MTDSPDQEPAHEPATVNLSEPWTAAYWARRLEVPVERLRAAVEAVGDEPRRVAEHLGRPWPFNSGTIV